MKLINLTPHALTIHGNGGILTLPPSGQVARLAVQRLALPAIAVDGITIPVCRPTLGAITGLPEFTEGVILVVSALVADAAKRTDVMSPGELVRDEAGVIIGALGLCSYA